MVNPVHTYRAGRRWGAYLRIKIVSPYSYVLPSQFLSIITNDKIRALFFFLNHGVTPGPLHRYLRNWSGASERFMIWPTGGEICLPTSSAVCGKRWDWGDVYYRLFFSHTTRVDFSVLKEVQFTSQEIRGLPHLAHVLRENQIIIISRHAF